MSQPNSEKVSPLSGIFSALMCNSKTQKLCFWIRTKFFPIECKTIFLHLFHGVLGLSLTKIWQKIDSRKSISKDTFIFHSLVFYILMTTTIHDPTTTISTMIISYSCAENFFSFILFVVISSSDINWPKTKTKEPSTKKLKETETPFQPRDSSLARTCGVLMECDCIWLWLIIKNDLNDWLRSMELKSWVVSEKLIFSLRRNGFFFWFYCGGEDCTPGVWHGKLKKKIVNKSWKFKILIGKRIDANS